MSKKQTEPKKTSNGSTSSNKTYGSRPIPGMHRLSDGSYVSMKNPKGRDLFMQDRGFMAEKDGSYVKKQSSSNTATYNRSKSGAMGKSSMPSNIKTASRKKK